MTERMPAFLNQLSANKRMLDLYSHSTRVLWFGHFWPDRGAYHRCFDLRKWPRQTRPLVKRYWRTLLKHIMGICVTIQKPCLTTRYNVGSMIWRPLSLNVLQMLNGIRMCFHRWPFQNDLNQHDGFCLGNPMSIKLLFLFLFLDVFTSQLTLFCLPWELNVLKHFFLS